MKQTKAPETTPSPRPGVVHNKTKVGNQPNPSYMFITLALDMSWRLAASVLVPILAGVFLDKEFNTKPILTIVGVVLALAFSFLVLRRTLSQAGNYTSNMNGSKT
ncbi:MAG TPA: AtpZ/AtpI family protein [Candidatus Sulfotelmatobacter sp.]|nr:AtpZ/AtpI family protein [Candidatus Sulfotelmatobacter sp.]